MVDFIKVIYHNAGFLRDHECLETLFKREVNLKTGETNLYEKAIFKNLEFKLYDSDLLILSGSLHKFYNHGQHNYNDFTFSQLQDTLLSLQNTFGLNLTACPIQNIEFGLNIKPPILSKEILDMLIIHKSKCFDRRFNGLMKEAVYAEYTCKYYDKGKQENLSHECFRYELKFIKSRQLGRFGISNLADLQKEYWIPHVKKQLSEHWIKTLFYDPTYSGPTKHEWQSPLYWKKLSNMQRSRNKRRFEATMLSHSKDLKGKIGMSIASKWKELESSNVLQNHTLDNL